AQRSRQARQQARESEDRVRLLLDSTVEAICGLDLDGLITFCNSAALRMLGLSTPEQLLGRPFYSRARLPGAEHPLPPVWIDAALRSYARLEQELQLMRDDGTLVPVQHSAAAMLRQGKLVGRVVTFLDVTERKRAEDMRTLSRMDDERVGPVDVEAALEASVNMVAHELRQRAQVTKNFGRVPRVRGNEGRLVQVFLNLLVNAVQAIAGNTPDRNEV